jgi:hypothetical protein
VRNGVSGTSQVDGIYRAKESGRRKPKSFWEWTQIVDSVEGQFFGKAQERSSEEVDWSLKRKQSVETEPH